MKNTLLRIIASAVVTSTSHAALVVYNMDTFVSPYSLPSSVSANLTASDFGTSPAYSSEYSYFTPAVSGMAVMEYGWNQTDQPNGQYFTFTIQPDSGYRMDISGFSFAETGAFPGSAKWALRSSIDSFSDDIAGGNASIFPGYGAHGISLSYANLTTPVEFRLYAYSLGAPNPGEWVVDNVSIAGP